MASDDRISGIRSAWRKRAKHCSDRGGRDSVHGDVGNQLYGAGGIQDDAHGENLEPEWGCRCEYSGWQDAQQVTGILTDANLLVLSINREAPSAMRENGVPIWSVMSLSLDGDTIQAALMLERSQTIKRGTGSKQIN